MTYHATQQLAEFVASTSLSSMPDEVVDRAKYFVLDYLGVALRGSCSTLATYCSMTCGYVRPWHLETGAW